MSNDLVVKQFNIDYSFIINNYLNPELWQKKWNLLIYKNFIFTLNIYSIDTEDEKIKFKIMLQDKNEYNMLQDKNEYNHWVIDKFADIVEYSLKIEDVLFLKKKIYTTMKKCIYYLEQYKIKYSKEYLRIEVGREQETGVLTKIANNFLDSENVTNSDIREAYIDVYIDNNSKISDYLRDYLYKMEYNEVTDLYLLLANINNDEDLLENVRNKTSDKDRLKELEIEVNEYIENLETEEFKEELSQKLEDI